MKKLLGDRVLIELKTEETTEGGFITQVDLSSIRPEEFTKGVVFAIGEAENEDICERLDALDEGDKVVFQYGKPISVDGKNYMLVGSVDIVLIS